MPHLQFETTIDLDRAAKHDFADTVTELYADHMATGTGHVAVTIHTLADGFFSLGRLEPDADAVMLNADIREGREFEQQRAFVRAAFETAHEQWAIPTANMYAVVTEHSGEQFHEYDRVLSSWDADETETGAD
ncbi:tautomerase [Halalkalicoccus subterraneus]|uniref:tautomerase n=1 Tax=Halalkalicoccus subterraneus TaxID=2675002 RepID=UPI000EFADDF8|nr:tautomerase [Halalkalicoccus subterraneus]